MRNVRLTLSYDGTDFNGWQIQAAGRTVQGVLEDALRRIHDRRIPVEAAGRTDSGVHARAQVVNFHTAHPSIPTEKFRDALNSLLPQDVRVHDSMEVDEAFHARYHARRREYRYYILPAAVASGYARRYCHRINNALHLGTANRMAAQLLGEQDFATFAAAGGSAAGSGGSVRHVSSASFFPAGRYLCFRIVANGFLWKMVRSIVGTVVDLAHTEAAVSAFRDALEARDRSRAGPTAPARGLFLQGVYYD